MQAPLNHDDGWRREFINVSVPVFATCLLIYQRSIVQTRARGIDVAHPTPPDMHAEIKAAMRALDPRAARKGAFWWYAIQQT